MAEGTQSVTTVSHFVNPTRVVYLHMFQTRKSGYKKTRVIGVHQQSLKMSKEAASRRLIVDGSILSGKTTAMRLLPSMSDEEIIIYEEPVHVWEPILMELYTAQQHYDRGEILLRLQMLIASTFLDRQRAITAMLEDHPNAYVVQERCFASAGVFAFANMANLTARQYTTLRYFIQSLRREEEGINRLILLTSDMDEIKRRQEQRQTADGMIIDSRYLSHVNRCYKSMAGDVGLQTLDTSGMEPKDVARCILNMLFTGSIHSEGSDH